MAVPMWEKMNCSTVCICRGSRIDKLMLRNAKYLGMGKGNGMKTFVVE